ncbi:MAG: hypothetical protein IPL77_11015 [Flavobacteriales bacterium]|nr:hypothetical protein [Flavobacteriales bacterium]
MTEHSCLRCRDYLEQERAWQQVLREKQDAWFKVRQDLELRLTLTECLLFAATVALVLIAVFGGG